MKNHSGAVVGSRILPAQREFLGITFLKIVAAFFVAESLIAVIDGLIDHLNIAKGSSDFSQSLGYAQVVGFLAASLGVFIGFVVMKKKDIYGVTVGETRKSSSRNIHISAYATDLVKLAEILREEHRFDEAIGLLRLRLRLDEEQYGSNHPCVAADLRRLAEILRSSGDLGGAEKLLRRALVIDVDHLRGVSVWSGQEPSSRVSEVNKGVFSEGSTGARDDNAEITIIGSSREGASSDDISSNFVGEYTTGHAYHKAGSEI